MYFSISNHTCIIYTVGLISTTVAFTIGPRACACHAFMYITPIYPFKNHADNMASTVGWTSTTKRSHTYLFVDITGYEPYLCLVIEPIISIISDCVRLNIGISIILILYIGYIDCFRLNNRLYRLFWYCISVISIVLAQIIDCTDYSAIVYRLYRLFQLT